MPPARKILIADPDPSPVRALAPALRQRGYQVHAAKDGAKALQVAILRFPDVVLFDERCQMLDARTFVRIIRTNPRTERIPVVLTGDMNERDSFFCRISTLAPLRAADGAYRDAGGCHTVSPTPIDWIVGTAPVGFSGYLRDTSTTSRRISDHFLIKATATLPAERSLTRCIPAPHDASAVYCPPPRHG